MDWLADTLNELVKDKPERELVGLKEIFQVTARYEYLFWEMAAQEESWPV